MLYFNNTWQLTIILFTKCRNIYVHYNNWYGEVITLVVHGFRQTYFGFCNDHGPQYESHHQGYNVCLQRDSSSLYSYIVGGCGFVFISCYVRTAHDQTNCLEFGFPNTMNLCLFKVNEIYCHTYL